MDLPDLPQTIVPHDERGCIAADLPCKRCSYNLRGLTEHGRCPECGTAVGRSLAGEYLRFASPDWVNKVALGLRILVLYIVVGTLLNCVAGGAVGFLAGAGGSQAAAETLMAALAILGPMVGLVAVWLMTTPDPSRGDDDPDRTLLLWLRIFAVTGIGFTLIANAKDMIAFSPELETVLDVLTVVGALASIINYYLIYTFYERLADRVPDEKLTKRARNLKWAYVISLGGLIAGGLFLGLMAAVAGMRGNWMTVGGCITGIFGLVLLIVSLLTVFLLVRLSRVVNRQAEYARETWAGGEGAVTTETVER